MVMMMILKSVTFYRLSHCVRAMAAPKKHRSANKSKKSRTYHCHKSHVWLENMFFFSHSNEIENMCEFSANERANPLTHKQIENKNGRNENLVVVLFVILNCWRA